jgi:hypothetical protein
MIQTHLNTPSDVRHANRPKNIRIHLAVSHVRFYPLRFNSSGNFCDRGASDEKRTLEQEKRCRKATITNATAAAVQIAVDETRPVFRGQTTIVLAGREPSHLVLSR